MATRRSRPTGPRKHRTSSVGVRARALFGHEQFVGERLPGLSMVHHDGFSSWAKSIERETQVELPLCGQTRLALRPRELLAGRALFAVDGEDTHSAITARTHGERA